MALVHLRAHPELGFSDDEFEDWRRRCIKAMESGRTDGEADWIESTSE
jgi:hypothetical protein